MSFWDHLKELRGHLVRSLISILLLSIIAFVNKDFVFGEMPKINFICARILKTKIKL